jgi:hypothetical protein
MRIIETEINDLQTKNSNELKINLANDVINYIQPIFNTDYRKKIKEVKKLKQNISIKKEKIKEEKNELEKIVKNFSKKNKEKELLNKMGKLIQTGLIQDSMKKEMTILLKSFENLPEDKIKSYLNEAIVLLSQKFAKS